MSDPVSRLKDTEEIAMKLIRLKRMTPTLSDELGDHPVDIALRGMVMVRQRLFTQYGVEHYNQSHSLSSLYEVPAAEGTMDDE